MKLLVHNSREWALVISTGLFMFVVLFLYHAFNIQTGISYSGHGLLFRSVAFGLVTSLSFAFNELLLKAKFQLSKEWEKVLWWIWELMLVANLDYLLFNFFWNWDEWYWVSYGLMMIEVPMVVLLPMIVVSLLYRKRDAIRLLTFKSETGKISIAVKPEHFLYLKSEENYVSIHHLVEGMVKTQLIRRTLKEVIKDFDSELFVQCHRSYVVNPDKVLRVIRQPRKMEVDMGYNQLVPVSKTYQDLVLSRVASR